MTPMIFCFDFRDVLLACSLGGFAYSMFLVAMIVVDHFGGR